MFNDMFEYICPYCHKKITPNFFNRQEDIDEGIILYDCGCGTMKWGTNKNKWFIYKKVFDEIMDWFEETPIIKVKFIFR